MGQIRLIATDIDGTLLPFARDRLPERVRTALTRVLSAGIPVVPASGRLISSVPEDILGLPGLRYVITCNGASITDLVTGVSIYDKRISVPVAARVLRRLEKYDAYSCVYLPGEAHNRAQLHPGIPKFYNTRVAFFSQNPHEDLPSFVEERGENAEKIFVAVFNPEERERIRRELEEFPEVRVTSSSGMNLEINHREADKGRAVAWLAQRLALRPENVAAMGDNENDLPMLRYAGTVIVPENAAPVARELASRIVPPCDQGGVAAFLEELLREEGSA